MGKNIHIYIHVHIHTYPSVFGKWLLLTLFCSLYCSPIFEIVKMVVQQENGFPGKLPPGIDQVSSDIFFGINCIIFSDNK